MALAAGRDTVLTKEGGATPLLQQPPVEAKSAPGQVNRRPNGSTMEAILRSVPPHPFVDRAGEIRRPVRVPKEVRTPALYRVVFEGVDGVTQVRTFDTAVKAFFCAETDRSIRTAELWEGGRKLCILQRFGTGRYSFWKIAPADSSSI